jgi:hypothetical protein
MRKHTSPYRNSKPGSSLARVLLKVENNTRLNSKERKSFNATPEKVIINSRHNSFECNSK